VTHFRNWPILEVSLLLIATGMYACFWRGVQLTSPATDERALAATTLSAAITGTLTVASILLSAALIGLQVIKDLPSDSKTHIRYAVWWSVLSLLAGAIDLSYLPSRVGKFDVATDRLVAMVGMWQLLLMVAGALRIVFAVRTALK
jgi:hypothetical protein